jgi:hypothetical protein
LDVGEKANEITCFQPLLDAVTELARVAVTSDAIHTQREHAGYLSDAGPTTPRSSKTTRRSCADSSSPPWKGHPASRPHHGHLPRPLGHPQDQGRHREQPPLPWSPQTVQLKRRRTDHKTGETTLKTFYADTSLTAEQATSPQLAKLVRDTGKLMFCTTSETRRSPRTPLN